jgi:peptidylprolyl isomerase
MALVDSQVNHQVIPQPKSIKDLRPKVYMEVTVDGKKAGRMVFQLEGDKAPRTVENFRALCTGEVIPKAEGVKLHLKGTRFHSVRPGQALIGGDVLRGNGTGGYSIYGPAFRNDARMVSFDKPGTISMVSEGRGLNMSSSIFFVSLEADASLYPTQIAFGHITEGLDVLERLVKLGDHGAKPTAEIVISDCGELTE